MHGMKECIAQNLMKYKDRAYFSMIRSLTSPEEVLHSEKLINLPNCNDVPIDVGKNSSCTYSTSKYADNLGPDTPEHLRQLAIDDNLKLLAERPEGFSQSDLTTLIHHCRKRKWPKQVDSVLNFISERVGISALNDLPIDPKAAGSTSYALRPSPMSYNDGSYSLNKSLFALTWIIYAAALDAYFSMNLADSAFLLYKTILKDCDEDSPTKKSLGQPEALIFILKGFFKCGRADYAVFVFDHSGTLPSHTAIMGLMHGLGKNVMIALRILSDIFNASCCTTEGAVHTLNTNVENRVELGGYFSSLMPYLL
jgi:hypothetical protein